VNGATSSEDSGDPQVPDPVPDAAVACGIG